MINISYKMQTIKVTYSDSKLRILIEEYIAMQRSEFTFKGVCSYILYRAMEEEKAVKRGELYDSDQLAEADSERVNKVLEIIVSEGRINRTNNGRFKKLI